MSYLKVNYTSKKIEFRVLPLFLPVVSYAFFLQFDVINIKNITFCGFVGKILGVIPTFSNILCNNQMKS